MDYVSRTRDIVALIERAFPAEPPPAANALVGHACEECYGVRTTLAGVHWTDLPDVVIDENFDKLPLLTPEAFVYYLPAFMRRAVQEPQEQGLGASKVLEFTVYSLCDDRLPDDPWWRERVKRFTRDQESAVAAFLRWIVGLKGFDGMEEEDVADARQGLATYWASRARSSHGA